MAIIWACVVALIVVSLVSKALRKNEPDDSHRTPPRGVEPGVWIPAKTSVRYSRGADHETAEEVYIVKCWTKDGWVYRPAKPEEYELFRKGSDCRKSATD